MVELADFLERVRERIVSDVVQQCRGAHDGACSSDRCAESIALRSSASVRERGDRCRARARSASGSRQDRRERPARAAGHTSAAERRACRRAAGVSASTRMLFQSGSRRISSNLHARRVDVSPAGPRLPICVGSRRPNFSKFFAEHPGELLRLRIVCFAGRSTCRAGSSTRPARRESHVGHGESEDRIVVTSDVVELTRRGRRGPSRACSRASCACRPRRVRRSSRCSPARRLRRAASGARRASRRTCVGMPDEEDRAEAGAERGLRLGHAALGARDFGRVAGEEIVHRLLGREPRDRRQHAERIGGQKDDVLRMPGATARRRVRDVVQRIGGARVLGDRLIGELHRLASRGSSTTFSRIVPNICVVR